MSEEEIIKKAEYIIKNGKAYQGSITEYFVELYYLFNKEKEKNKELEKKLDEISDEERKAIERVEQFIDGERQYNTKTGETIIPYEYGESQRFVYKETYYAIQVVLNLIEKQSKEIEELKETLKCTQNSWYEDAKIIDKIKAKIEELEKQDGEDRMSHNYLVIPVLQSLLEDNTEEIEETNLYYVTCESDFKNMNIVKILNEFFEKNDLIVNELVRAVNKIRRNKNVK